VLEAQISKILAGHADVGANIENGLDPIKLQQCRQRVSWIRDVMENIKAKLVKYVLDESL